MLSALKKFGRCWSYDMIKLIKSKILLNIWTNFRDIFDISVLVVLTGFLICEILATITLILSYKKRIQRYVFPRITLLLGQFVTITIICIILIAYFGGFSPAINEFILNIYEVFTFFFIKSLPIIFSRN